MGLLELILVIVLICLLCGGGLGYRRGGPEFVFGPSGGVIGLLLLIVLIFLLVRVL